MAIPTVDEVWADFNPDGSVKEPAKQDIRRLLRFIQALAEAAGVGAKSYVTKAAMDADLSQPDGTLGLIYADATDVNNFPTLWYWNDAGNVWVQGVDRIASLQTLINGAFGFVGGLTINNLLRIVGAGYSLDLEDSNYWWSFKNPAGDVVLGCLKADGKVYGNFANLGSGNTSFDAENIAATQAILDRRVIGFASPNFDVNIIPCIGQSREFGTEGWPALSKSIPERLKLRQFGASVRPAGNPVTTTTFDPVGGSATLQPLKATVESGSGTLLDDATVAALTPGASNPGEAPVIARVRFARELQLSHLGLDEASNLWVVVNACSPGMTIEQLSKGASPNLYNRALDAIDKVIAAKPNPDDTVGVPFVYVNEGEFNSIGASGGTQDKAAFKALANAWLDDNRDDFMAKTGQALPPRFLVQQTDSTYARNSNNLAMAMAWLEISLERDDVILMGGLYPYTDKNGHLDPNGYRALGVKGGEITFKTACLGKDFTTVRPRKITQGGRSIFIDCYVPAPPLVFDDPYVILTATDYADKGFQVTDDSGTVPITAVTILGMTRVMLALGRDTVGTVHVWFGDQTHAGGGCLRDSSAWVPSDSYVYATGIGQYAEANIPELIGKPYATPNWAIGFYLPVT